MALDGRMPAACLYGSTPLAKDPRLSRNTVDPGRILRPTAAKLDKSSFHLDKTGTLTANPLTAVPQNKAAKMFTARRAQLGSGSHTTRNSQAYSATRP